MTTQKITIKKTGFSDRELFLEDGELVKYSGYKLVNRIDWLGVEVFPKFPRESYIIVEETVLQKESGNFVTLQVI